MRLILNGHAGVATFDHALTTLLQDAETVSAAVSYIQVGGWELFRSRARDLDFASMRIVCTDQFAITQPAAIKRALSSKVQIRNFNGSTVYHPKVFLSHGRAGRPSRFLLGSANLSGSAFSKSCEAGVLGDDQVMLHSLNGWFDNLFKTQTSVFTPELLIKMEARWQQAAANRIWTRTQVRKHKLSDVLEESEPEDTDVLEDALATLALPLGLLNMDYAGNNVRTISKMMRDLGNPNRAQSGKTRSEMKLLGFMEGSSLTPLGSRARNARTPDQLALIWCSWIKSTSDSELATINPRLMAAKRVFTRFWELAPEVRDFFFANLDNRAERLVLQTIELLCNGAAVVQSLSVEEIRLLSELLHSGNIPAYIREEISEYEQNKGTRGWSSDDRRVVVNAWLNTQ